MLRLCQTEWIHCPLRIVRRISNNRTINILVLQNNPKLLHHAIDPFRNLQHVWDLHQLLHFRLVSQSFSDLRPFANLHQLSEYIFLQVYINELYSKLGKDYSAFKNQCLFNYGCYNSLVVLGLCLQTLLGRISRDDWWLVSDCLGFQYCDWECSYLAVQGQVEYWKAVWRVFSECFVHSGKRVF